MPSVLQALKLDSVSRKQRKARKAVEALEKAYDKAMDAEMEDFLTRGQVYFAPSAESMSSDSPQHEKEIAEFYHRRSLVYAKKMIESKKRRFKKRIVHGAAFVTALGGTIAATVASHGVLAPSLALPGVVMTWALADSAVERKKKKALKEEMRQPASGALQLYLKEREGEDVDEDEDEKEE
ncbi:hypothetical protein MMC26_004343 [Xylographa opegraphella]|nr:hypothetical protein [Xylographa opegraphella]